MSTFEYNNLYLKCQDTGKYHMFVFDIIGSKNMTFAYRNEAENKMIDLTNKIYETIQELTKKYKK